MTHIKRFIDKISAMESKQNKDVVMTMTDARGLRDEIAKLLVDLHVKEQSSKQDIITVDVSGGSFK